MLGWVKLLEKRPQSLCLGLENLISLIQDCIEMDDIINRAWKPLNLSYHSFNRIHVRSSYEKEKKKLKSREDEEEAFYSFLQNFVCACKRPFGSFRGVKEESPNRPSPRLTPQPRLNSEWPWVCDARLLVGPTFLKFSQDKSLSSMEWQNLITLRRLGLTVQFNK